MPDGEVFTSPVENSAEGHVEFSYPSLYRSIHFEGIRVEFKKGKAVKATATKNGDKLNKILDTDRGARFVGEIGIGTNYSITRFVNNTLFDEKITTICFIAFPSVW